MEEAESAMTRLCGLVEQVLADNQGMSRRLRNMDDKPVHIPHSPGPSAEDDTSTTSSRTVTPPPPDLPRDDLPENVPRTQFDSAFEEELHASCVYRKPLFRDSRLSTATSAARTTASSVLSALSLTDVSNISILAVPIYADEISNQDRYGFGDFHWETSNIPGTLSHRTVVKSQKNASKTNRWEGFVNAVSRRRLHKATNLGASQELGRRLSKNSSPEPLQEPIKTVLGASLSEVIGIAKVDIKYYNDMHKSPGCYYLPRYICEIGEFLRVNGMLFPPNPI